MITLPLSQPGQRRLPRWAMALLLGVMALLALAEAFGGRGFAAKDELLLLLDVSRRTLGGPARTPWGNGSLLKTLQAWCWQASGSWQALHVPVLAAMAVYAWSLASIARRLGGVLAAQGAVLVALLSATTLLHSRSFLPFAILAPLLSAALALMLGGRWLALLGGALLAAGFLEYEATVLALPGVLAFWVLEKRAPRGHLLWALAGFSLGLAVVLWVCRASLGEWWYYRSVYNAPLGHASPGALGGQLRQWLLGGRPEPYMGVSGHPVIAWWALPLVLAGLLLQLRRRPWLLLWIAAGMAALVPASGAFEAHRTAAAFPALALAGGLGWRWAWLRLRRQRYAAWLFLLLPLAGLLQEQRAVERSLDQGQELYRRSQAWMAAARDPSVASQVDALLLPAGLALEAVLGRPAAPASAPWVWMPVDLAQDAPVLPGLGLRDRGGKLSGDVLLQVPLAHPLRQDLVTLRQLWTGFPALRPAMAAACREALQPGKLSTPLARSAVWLTFFHEAVPSRSVTPQDLLDLDREGFRSPLFYRSATFYAQYDPRLWHSMLWLARKHSGAESLKPAEKALLAQPFEQLPRVKGSPDWPGPRALTRAPLKP